MRYVAWVIISITLVLGICCQAIAEELMGEVVEIKDKAIVARFPAPVDPHSMIIIMSGVGDGVAGAAISNICTGNDGPYIVRGKITFVAKASAMIAGQKCYVNSLNAGVAPVKAAAPAKLDVQSSANPASIPCAASPALNQDLKLYYYAAGENVGYGALGLGYDRTLQVTKSVSIELDGGITAVGNVSDYNSNVVNTDQLIKNLNGRLKFNFARDFGFYSGYRWSQARGDDAHWYKLSSELAGKEFVAPSAEDSGTVQLQGIEYGLTLRPIGKMTMSMGYIPNYRADIGGYGVISEPAYTGELRFGTKSGALRLRGVRAETYWQADLGITIQ